MVSQQPGWPPPETPKAAEKRLKEKAKQERKLRRTSGDIIEQHLRDAVKYVFLAGVSLAIVFTVQWEWASTWIPEAAVGLAVFLAAAAVGSLAGFLFGLPRDAPATSTDKPILRFVFNSNLLKVSDWLTTIIVGLTLVNLRSIGPAAAELANSLEDPLGGSDQAGAFGLAIVVFGFVAAALVAYVWASVRLREHLELSEMELLDRRHEREAIQEAQKFIEDQDQATLADVRVKIMATPTSSLERVRARLPDALDGEQKVRRDQVAKIVEEELEQRTT